MRIYIVASDEPVFINPFLRQVVSANAGEIVGIALVKGSALKTYNQGRLSYLIALLLITSPLENVKRAVHILRFKIANLFDSSRAKNPWSLHRIALDYDVPYTVCEDVNGAEFLDQLRGARPDVVIAQANAFLKKEFLAIPSHGTLNRHAALLPKYRGRLAPFWAYTNGEPETGLSIHYLTEKLDAGDILVQKRIPIARFDRLETLLKRIFAVAPDAMNEALDLIRTGKAEDAVIANSDEASSYYSSPKPHDALRYRWVMLRRFVYGR